VDGPSAAFAPDGRSIAAEGPSTVIWDIASRRPQAILPARMTGGAFSRDSRLFAAASSTQPLADVWDARTGALLAQLPPRPPRTLHQVTIPDPYPVQGGYGSSAGSAAPGEPPRGPGPAFILVPAAAVSPDGNLVATWGRTGQGAQLWQPFGTSQLALLRRASTVQVAGESLLLPAVLNPDGQLLATANPDGAIDVWRTRDGGHVATLSGASGYVSALAFNPAGDQLAATGFDGKVRIWHLAGGLPLDTLHGNTKRVGGLAFSPDGSLIASAGEDGTVRVWHVNGGEVVKVLNAGGPVASVAFSRDGRLLIAGGSRGTTRVWSARDWQPYTTLTTKGANSIIVDATASSNGRYVATLDSGATARLWHSRGGSPIRTLHNIASIAFAPSGDQLVTGGGDGTAHLLLSSDGTTLGILRGHTNTVANASFSPDATLIVTAGIDGTARVWQAATDGTVVTVTPSRAPVEHALLAANGHLVTISDDGVRLYTCQPCLPPTQLLALAGQRLRPSRAHG
jgi:WD40 repeat protein